MKCSQTIPLTSDSFVKASAEGSSQPKWRREPGTQVESCRIDKFNESALHNAYSPGTNEHGATPSRAERSAIVSSPFAVDTAICGLRFSVIFSPHLYHLLLSRSRRSQISPEDSFSAVSQTGKLTQGDDKFLAGLQHKWPPRCKMTFVELINQVCVEHSMKAAEHADPSRLLHHARVRDCAAPRPPAADCHAQLHRAAAPPLYIRPRPITSTLSIYGPLPFRSPAHRP